MLETSPGVNPTRASGVLPFVYLKGRGKTVGMKSLSLDLLDFHNESTKRLVRSLRHMSYDACVKRCFLPCWSGTKQVGDIRSEQM